MAKGGARAGAGRKPIHDQIAARDLAVSAIVSKFGSMEAGMINLLESGEASLIKFVYEHALGKPKDIVDSSVKFEEGGITLNFNRKK